MSSPTVDALRASSPPFGASHRWEDDRAARDEIRAVLAKLPPGFVVFHDLELPKPSRSVIDHLIVGPRNVWAVTTHLSTEPVTIGSGRNADTLWAGRIPLRTELDAADSDAVAIADLIGVAVEPVVCLIAPALPEPSFDFRGVRVCAADQLMPVVEAPTEEFVDVAALEATVEQVFGSARAAGAGVPTLAQPTTQPRDPVPLPRRRRTIGARIHSLRSMRAVRVGLVLVLLAVALAFLPTIVGTWDSVASEGADRLTDVIDEVDNAATEIADASPPTPVTAVPTAAPAPAGYELSCPSPGDGWLATWSWPGPLPEGVAGYSVRTQVGDSAPVVHSALPWSDPTSPPPAFKISQSGSTTVFTEHRDANGSVVATAAATITPPTEVC